jgi:hypothetical protein
VWFSSWQLDNINHNYLLPIDLESYRQLKNHIAKALVPLLQIWLFASHKAGSFEKRYEELCEILDVAKHRAPSLISRQLKPSLDELVHHGYLEKWRIEKTSDLKAYKVILFHGPKFHRDRRKRIEQKSQTSELIIVAQSESPDKPISLELGKLESALQEAAAEEMPMTRARAATRRSAPIEKPEKAARESRSTMAAEGKTSDFESVLLDELVARGLIASATVNLLNSLPPDRLNSVRDYIEYWDFVRAGKKVGPGFLYDLIRNGKPLPPTFETNKQRAERKAKEERQGQLIMAKQSLEFAYDEYRQNTTDRFLSEQFPKNEIERRIKEKKAEFNSQRGIWGNRPDLNDRMAWHSVRAEIGEQVPLLSFQEFCRREASRILADYQIDPAELDISVSLP